ncbi:hypothetical protein D3C84_1126540 [compost metagenome]
MDVVVADAAGRAVGIGVEYGGEVAGLLGGVHEHAPQLAAAHHAERGPGEQRALQRDTGTHSTTPTLATSCAALPPKGAFAPSGGRAALTTHPRPAA